MCARRRSGLDVLGVVLVELGLASFLSLSAEEKGHYERTQHTRTTLPLMSALLLMYPEDSEDLDLALLGAEAACLARPDLAPVCGRSRWKLSLSLVSSWGGLTTPLLELPAECFLLRSPLFFRPRQYIWFENILNNLNMNLNVCLPAAAIGS